MITAGMLRDSGGTAKHFAHTIQNLFGFSCLEFPAKPGVHNFSFVFFFPLQAEAGGYQMPHLYLSISLGNWTFLTGNWTFTPV